jgi:hypothetical protein
MQGDIMGVIGDRTTTPGLFVVVTTSIDSSNTRLCAIISTPSTTKSFSFICISSSTHTEAHALYTRHPLT